MWIRHIVWYCGCGYGILSGIVADFLCGYGILSGIVDVDVAYCLVLWMTSFVDMLYCLVLWMWIWHIVWYFIRTSSLGGKWIYFRNVFCLLNIGGKVHISVSSMGSVTSSTLYGTGL